MGDIERLQAELLARSLCPSEPASFRFGDPSERNEAGFQTVTDTLTLREDQQADFQTRMCREQRNMAEIYYDVPRLDQHKIFTACAHGDNMACWYTSVFMILLYKMGPAAVANSSNINTLFRLFNNKGIIGQGINYGEYPKLAQEVGLEIEPSQILLNNKSESDYCTTLTRVGPLLMCVPGHVIVVTGCTKSVISKWQISYNDPWDGKEYLKSVMDFNNSINWARPVLYRRNAYEPLSPLRRDGT